MKQLAFSIIIFLVFIFEGKAQNLEFGKVLKSELEEKFHKIDTSAVAAILFKKAKTTFNYSLNNGFAISTEFSIKIKIYKKEGLKWAAFEIPYYVGYEKLGDEKVIITNAFTYNLVDGKIVKEKVSSESKFKEKTNEFWQTKIITFPNVKEGSIIELRYEYKSENLSEFPIFQYQYKIPVNYAQYITEIPLYFLYNATQIGLEKVTLEDKLEQVTARYDNASGMSDYVSFQQIKTKYEAFNVPKLIEEEYVNNMDYYYGKIVHELKTVQFPNQQPTQIASSWESVAKSIFEEKDFGAELNKSDYFTNDLNRIIDKIDSMELRLKVIFEFVKNKMNWNGNLGFFTKSGVVATYNENTGNVAEINLMLIAMLKASGLDASPVLLSTKGNGATLFPNKSKFDYVIASVVLDGKQYLLDATCKYCSIFNLPIRDLNDKGRLINKDGNSSEIDLILDDNSINKSNVIANIDAFGTVSGQVSNTYFDFEALKFRENFSGVSHESIVENLEKKYTGLEIENYELKNDKLIYEPIIEKFSIINKNVVEIIGDRIFFSPMLCFALTQNPFRQERRQYPVNFPFPTKNKYLISINIPEGYVIESLPESIAIGINEKKVTFKFALSAIEKQITVNVNLDVNSTVIPLEEYDNLKQFFKLVIEKENEKIILKKL